MLDPGIGARSCDKWEHFLQFVDQVVYAYEERFSARVWAAGNQFRRMLGEHKGTRIASPTTNFAVRHQCQAAQVITTTGLPQVCEQLLETQLQVPG